MSRFIRTLVVAALAVPGAACSDFLSGDKLDADPNRPTSAAAAQLFTAVQVNSYYILNGHAARVLAMWMQGMAGTDRQYIGYDQYSIVEGAFGEYSAAYTGGGLIDMRAVEAGRTNGPKKKIATAGALPHPALAPTHLRFPSEVIRPCSASVSLQCRAREIPTRWRQAFRRFGRLKAGSQNANGRYRAPLPEPCSIALAIG